MDSWEYIYHVIFFIAFLSSFLVLKSKNSALRVFPILLFIGNIVDISAGALKMYNNPNYPLLYHFYIPAEYILLSYFYFKIFDNRWFKNAILISVPAFVITCILLSLNASKDDRYPTMQFNIEGVLIICWALFNLFSLKSEENIVITKHPFFWISIGLLFFYTGNFFLMGSYNQIVSVDKALAKKLFKYINTTLNCSLYILFIIGFLCSSKQARKY